MRTSAQRLTMLLGVALVATLLPGIALANPAETSARLINDPYMPKPSPADHAEDVNPLTLPQTTDSADRGDAARTASDGLQASKMRQRRKDFGAKHGAALGRRFGGERGAKMSHRVGKHLLGSKTSHRMAGHVTQHLLDKAGF